MRNRLLEDKEEIQKTVEELMQQVSAKEAELEKERAPGTERLKALERELADVKGERDAQTKEKEETQKTVEKLMQQVSAKAAELETEKKVSGDIENWTRCDTKTGPPWSLRSSIGSEWLACQKS